MKLKLYDVAGHWWLGCEINGRVYLLTYKGKVGDLISL